MKNKNQNRETWVGYRPSIMPAKKKNKKQERKEGKQICRDAIKKIARKRNFIFISNYINVNYNVRTIPKIKS